MKRIRTEKQIVRRNCECDALPLHPRDPDILRANQLMYAQKGRGPSRPTATAMIRVLVTCFQVLMFAPSREEYAPGVA